MRSMYFDAVAAAAPMMHLDAGETAAFSRQLEAISTQLYNVKYAKSMARGLFSMVSNVGPAHDSYTYRTFDRFGEWKAIADYGDDFPSVEIIGSETSTKIKSFGASYGYSLMDMRQSQLMSVDLPNERAAVVRERFEALVDKLACVGDSDLGITGIANASGITDLTSSVTNDWTSSSTLVTDILNDVDKMVKKLFDDSQGLWAGGYVLLLPTTAYSALRTRRVSPGFGDNRNLLDYILSSTAGLSSIQHWPRLDTAGTSSLPRAVMMVDSPEIAQLLLPQDFEQGPPQARNMKFNIWCHGRCGGVVVRYLKGVLFTDGIVA